MSFVRKHINKELIISDKQIENIQQWQYPLDAIRELVLNMIIHRDYTSSSDSQIKIFTNHILFFNPGSLPDSITIEQLLANTYVSTPRNRQIAKMVKEMGMIEKYGSGIRRIFSSFEQEKLPDPQFCNISDGFMVTVFCERIDIKLGDKLGDKQILILDSIKKDPYLSLSQLTKIIGISQTAVENNVDKLKKIGLLTRIGSPKGGHWKVKF